MGKAKTASLRILRGIAFVAFWFGVLLYLSQDIQIFPLATSRLLGSPPQQYSSLPTGIQARTIHALDGTALEVWKSPRSREVAGRQHLRAIILHGNGATLMGFRSMQQWMSSLGISNYSLDYRGTGASAGWPSEEGIFLDVLGLYHHILKEDGVAPEDILVVGLSIGTGFSAGLAAQIKARALVLFAPYESIDSLVAERPILRPYSFLLRYHVPTADFVSTLTSTCVILAHGQNDTIIPVGHSRRIAQRWNQQGMRWFKEFENTGHNDLFSVASSSVADALASCLATEHDSKSSPRSSL